MVKPDCEVDRRYKPNVDGESLAAELGSVAEGFVPGGCGEISIALSFVPPGRIRELNARHRGVDEETDVLSFPLWEECGAFRPPDGWDELPLGDVVVSPAYVFNSAKDRNIDYNSEIILVIVHGALHLLGFDHDTEGREREMWGIQEALVEKYFCEAGKRKNIENNGSGVALKARPGGLMSE
jgi:probable rRNA maturation factor